MTAARTCHWRVQGTGKRGGERESITLSVQTARKDDEAAASEFRNAARDIGYTDIRVDDVRLTREE